MKKILILYITLIFIILLAPAVYPATRTFTNCAQTGIAGPSQAQCNTAYSGTTLQGFVTVTSGIQYWTVPSTGTYIIEVWGAQGGNGAGTGGYGARMKGTFQLVAGQQLKIIVGQRGGSDSAGGGGGGTFVTNTANTPLIIAGGGGGGTVYSSIFDASMQATTSTTAKSSSGGSNLGGVGGGGGLSNTQHSGGGGGGLTGNGQFVAPALYFGHGGTAFVNGGVGGSIYYVYANGLGGFGGGGRSSHNGGGGGGYSGGAGGYHSTQRSGGGGSYNSGSAQSNSDGVNTAMGYVTIISYPIISSVTDSPDPVNSGLPVKLSAYWTSDIGSSVKLHACKTDSMTGTSCTSGYWCDTTAEWDSTSPSNCSYLTQPGDNATTHDYYLFVCDSDPQCSLASNPNQGSFTVRQSTVLGVVESWLRIANNLIIGNTITIS